MEVMFTFQLQSYTTGYCKIYFIYLSVFKRQNKQLSDVQVHKLVSFNFPCKMRDSSPRITRKNL